LPQKLKINVNIRVISSGRQVWWLWNHWWTYLYHFSPTT